MERWTTQAQSAEDRAEVERAVSEIRRDFEGRPEELIPMLQRVQGAVGYLPERALLEVAQLTGLPAATVFGVATFYSQFRLQPVGKYIVRVCRGTACHVRGSGRILRDIQVKLKIPPGETTEDRLFTLETVACFGSCALAPVIVLDDSVHGRMNPTKACGILEERKVEAEGKAVGSPLSSLTQE